MPIETVKQDAAILPCRACGGKANMGRFGFKTYYICTNYENCAVSGPLDDPDGAKWNVLMAPAAKPTPEGAVKVEIAALIDEKGNWCASGWSGARMEDMMESAYTMDLTDPYAQPVTITAYLTPPKVQEVEGEVK